MLRWILSYLVPALVFAFKCALCGLVQHLTRGDAERSGWRKLDGKWCCEGCINARQPL